jgi:N-acetylmuramoyl-L-alanine amidase
MFELIQNTHIDQSVAFAGILQDSFRQHAQRASRDVRQAGFLVLRETAMPGVLIETGYLSNQAEANYLLTNEGRETLAFSIFNSFKEYKEKYESRLNLVSGESKKEQQ